jgi:hypothetical protein
LERPERAAVPCNALEGSQHEFRPLNENLFHG